MTRRGAGRHTCRGAPYHLPHIGNFPRKATMTLQQTLRALSAWADQTVQPHHDGALDPDRAVAGLVPNPWQLILRPAHLRRPIDHQASQISQQGQGYQDTPGIYSKEQVAGWRKVTERVHARGGHIFVQLWHVGRISHVDLQENKQAPVAPSAIAAKGKTFVGGTFADVSAPRALRSRKFPASSTASGAPPPMPARPASTASRSTAPTAICWTSSPRTAPTSAPTATVARSRTAPG